MNIISKIQSDLFKHQDKKYRDFHAHLIPDVNKETVIGVRTPIVKSLAKKYQKEKDIEKFIKTLPHQYYEEYNLHGFIINEEKNYLKAIKEINRLLPYINNWATCDSLDIKIFKKHKEELIKEIKHWLNSKKPFTIRFAIRMLMKYYLDEDYQEVYLKLVSDVKSNHYYVKMMQAWYFATALIKQQKSAIKYIQEKKLSIWVHNKAIQKALESYCIKDKDKQYLRSLKIKNI